MFKKLRVFILLFILATVSLGAWRAKARATEWKLPLQVAIYPINGDGSAASAQYISALTLEIFKPIERFFTEEAERYEVTPLYGPIVEVNLAPEVHSLPPPPPPAGNTLQIILWSLELRYWAWRNDSYPGPAPQARLFVSYYDAETHKRLAHSLGLEKGMIGMVNAFSAQTMAGSNNFVIAHELLHTVGATDKYSPATNLPMFPGGYAEPDSNPLHPQRFAEIMGGRIPLSETSSEIPRNLNEVLVGEETAREINWIEKSR